MLPELYNAAHLHVQMIHNLAKLEATLYHEQ